VVRRVAPGHRALRRFAREHGFTVSSVRPAERFVHLTGPASDLAAAFGVNVARYRVGHVTWTGYKGFLHVPAALADCVTAVFGFDDRPQARRGPVPDAAAAIASRPRTSYTPPEVAELSAFPGRRMAIMLAQAWQELGYMVKVIRASWVESELALAMMKQIWD